MTATVGELQRRLQEAIEQPSAPMSAGANGLEMLIEPTLSAIGWKGHRRRILEALPYLGRIETSDDLRTLLLHLDVATPVSEINAGEITPAHVPCLLVGADDSVALITRLAPDGKAVLRLASGAEEKIALARLQGRVHLPQIIEIHAEKAAAVNGWIKPTLLRLKPQLRRLFLLTFSVNAIGLVLSLYSMLVFDKAVGGKSLDTLAMLFVGAVAAIGLMFYLQRVRALVVAQLATRLDNAIRNNVFKALLNLPISMIEASPASAQLSQMRQLEIGKDIIGGQLAGALFDLPFTLLFIGLIFVLGGPLGFVPFAATLILGAMAALAYRGMQSASRESAVLHSRSEAMLIEFASRIHTIRDDGAEEIFRERSNAVYRDFLIKQFAAKRMESRLSSWAQAIGVITTAALLGLGALRVLDKSMTMGALIAAMLVVGRVMAPIQMVLLSMQRMFDLVSTSRQLDTLIRMHIEGKRPITVTDRLFEGAIRLKGVTFRYQGSADIALRGVSLDIPAGQFVTITGQSGAGKSTLLKLLLGLYEPLTGQIQIDGHDLRQLDQLNLRQSVGYLAQTPDVFYGTLAANIRLAAPEASEARMRQALATVGITLPHDLLPEGLETRIRGGLRERTSAAFLQRVSLARLLCSDHNILLLDEPGQHIDAACDEALMSYIDTLKGKATIVMVTPRPSHMRRADRIIILGQGSVLADDTPQKLLPRLINEISRPVAPVAPVRIQES